MPTSFAKSKSTMANAFLLLLWNAFFPPAQEMQAVSRARLETPYASAPLGGCFNQEICLYGRPDGKGNIVLTVQTAAQGWIGLGVGNAMEDSFMFVAWKNSSDGITLSDRSPADHTIPPYAANQVSKIVTLDSTIASPSWAKMSFSFSRPIESPDVTFTPTSSFIYAYTKSKKPTALDNPAASISFHNVYNFIGELDLIGRGDSSPPITTTTTTTTSSPSPTTTIASTSGKCVGTSFCLYGQPDGAGNVVFTIHSSANGWVGFGTGSLMAGSSMTVGWKNSSGGITISDRIGSGHSLPSTSPPLSRIVQLKVEKPSWANIAFSFSRPISTSSYSLTSSSQYIYADSSSTPSQPDSSASSFSFHSNFGGLGALDFVSSTGSGVAVSSTTTSAPNPLSTSTSSSATSKCVPNTFCIYGEPDGSGNVLITVHSSASGWVAFGIGSSMSSATTIVAWKNSQGGYTVSDRISRSRSLPSFSPNQQSTIVQLKHAAPSWANLAFTISRPLKSIDVTITSASPYIYAYSNTAPSNPNSASSAFVQHDSFGSLGALDFTTNSGNQGTSTATGGNGAVSSGANGAVSSNGIGSICIANLFCVYSEPDGNGNVYISLVSAANGWVGLGVGSVMTGSSIILGWPNSAGGITVSDRKASGYTIPDSIQTVSKVVPFRGTKPAWASLAFTVIRPLLTPDMTFTPSTSFIYAYSSTAPSDIDSPSSLFGIHSGRGVLGVLDFTSLHNGTATSSSSTQAPTANTNTNTTTNSNDSVGSMCIQDQFCVYSDPDLQGNVYITIHSSLGGWVGLGTGDTMTGSVMLIGWKNSTGGYTVSDRQASSQAMPATSISAKSVVVPLRVEKPSWASLAFTVLRPIQGDYTPTTHFIYGASGNAPSDIDSSTSSFSIHQKYALLGNLDFTTKHDGVKTTSGGGFTSILPLPAGVEYSTVLRLHGYIMIYAWLFCPVVAIFIARYLKNMLGHRWFQLHVLIMVGGTGLGTVAAILLVVFFKPGSVHFGSSPSIHPLLGLIVGILMVVQMLLGVASDKLWSPDRESVPWWDKAHWWLGRVSVVLAFSNIWTGIVYSETFSSFAMALPILFGLFTAAGIGAFAYGELRLGQIHHIAGSDNPTSASNLLKSKDELNGSSLEI